MLTRRSLLVLVRRGCSCSRPSLHATFSNAVARGERSVGSGSAQNEETTSPQNKQQSTQPPLHQQLQQQDSVDYKAVRKERCLEWQHLPEVIARDNMIIDIRAAKGIDRSESDTKERLQKCGISKKMLEQTLNASLLTFCLHAEARIASSLSMAYYTIGPCGEEQLSTIGLNLRTQDPSALHYRHVGPAIMRQILSGADLGSITLDRCRGFVCSSLDPVTGGRHCSIGGSSFDYLVTSTFFT